MQDKQNRRKEEGHSHGRGEGPSALDDHDAGERGSASPLSERLGHWLLSTLKT